MQPRRQLLTIHICSFETTIFGLAMLRRSQASLYPVYSWSQPILGSAMDVNSPLKADVTDS